MGNQKPPQSLARKKTPSQTKPLIKKNKKLPMPRRLSQVLRRDGDFLGSCSMLDD
jgi:hypothetical protein